MNNDELMKGYRLSYTKITDKTLPDGKEEYPVLPCEIDVMPDYLCLYGNPKDYNLTDKTCVCFYEFDNEFDGINGLFNAIYYDNKELLDYYKERFKNVWMVIEPDYSQVRDIELIENKYRQFRARVVGLWFLTIMEIPVIPNINYADDYSFEYMLDGIRKAKTLAISLKGIMDKPNEEALLKRVIKYVVDNTLVKNFIVFSTGIIDEKVNEYFLYARLKHINICIPDNSMRLRNLEKKNKSS